MGAAEATKRLYCPADRYLIEDLVRLIDLSTENLHVGDIRDVLEWSVNMLRERIAYEHKTGGFTTANSISAYEAYNFIRRLAEKGTLNTNTHYGEIGRRMHDIFFEGRLFAGLHKPQGVRILEYHDADTCTITRPQGNGCNTSEATVSVRISGIDAPEVGDYDEQLADGVRKKGKKKYPYGKICVCEEPKTGWINGKLVENVDKIHIELAKGRWNPKTITYAEREAINNIIAATINYTGELATIPMADLLSFEIDETQRGAALMFDSEVRWTSDDTPAALCGSWQPYDIFGRTLGGFRQNDPKRLARYIRTRLAAVMREKGATLYESYRAKIAPHLAVLERSGNAKLKATAIEIAAKAPKPTEAYDQKKCEEMATAYEGLKSPYGEAILVDNQIFQIIIGSAYAYMKYRNQHGGIYRAAGDIARSHTFGLWNDATFKALWDVNSGNPRYHPDDCRPA